MDLLLALVAFEIIASKFLVSYISSYGPAGSYEEKNPLLRTVFKRLKLQHDVWLSFFCTVLLTAVIIFMLTSAYTATVYQLVFVLAGFYTTVLNLGAAHSVYFQKNNFITRRLLR
ncbi:hypothetical protein [Salinimicrobium terrae]|uniref:hypothetical protein n=1 Tax=Salinimicrobium terrae TaxID=470866 RepID=UPI00041E1996|nr:hypothetical protein [Salinimicrobium terrae]